MEHLFFDSNDDISCVAATVFGLLRVESILGQSSNVLNETYHDVSLFGVIIRLEENCYDYEEQFRFMLSVKRDLSSNILVRENDVLLVSRIIQHLLADNLGFDIAIEVGTSIERCSPIAE